jgi:hypothetical protein
MIEGKEIILHFLVVNHNTHCLPSKEQALPFGLPCSTAIKHLSMTFIGYWRYFCRKEGIFDKDHLLACCLSDPCIALQRWLM